MPQNARIIGMSGHLHDIDIIDPSPCPVHCASRGEAIALSAELLGGDGNDYFGPIPPNNPPPADITGATLCRSRGVSRDRVRDDDAAPTATWTR